MSEWYENPELLCPQERISVNTCPNFSMFGFSSRGQSHIGNNTPGQDANYTMLVNKSHPTIIASIADGLGSSALSHYGSSIAAKAATEYLAKVFDKIDISTLADNPRQIGNYIRLAMRKAYEEVNNEANKNEILLYTYQSTLTTAIYDGNNLYFGHIGDDGIVVLTQDGKLNLVTTRHGNAKTRQVDTLQSGADHWQIGKVTGTIDGIIMATDRRLRFFCYTY